MGREVTGTTPLEDSAPQTSTPSTVAAGVPAILSTMKHGFSKVGVLSTVKTLGRVNRFGGFDCPGCAWPDPDNHRTIAEFCENGAKAVADEATSKRITNSFWESHSVSELSIRSDQWLNDQGRLTSPVFLDKDSDYYTPVTWSTAFSLIADELESLSNPNEAIFYTSGRTSNEAAFLWQLLARAFGTNNLPDCSNMCHESSGFALNDAIGIGKGTVTLDDFNESDLILVVGQNPGTNHPRMLTALRDARANGASVISINPLIETGMKRFKHPQNPLEMLGSGSEIADQHVQIQINGDLALFRGINHHLLSNDDFDPKFIENHTAGFDEFKHAIAEVDWSLIEEYTGLTRQYIEDLAERIASAESMIICWAMGITQHHNSVQTIQEMLNTLLLGGHIGRPGAGVCPVRGHSNVQGDRTVGINHIPSSDFIANLYNSTGVQSPDSHGYDAVTASQAMLDGDAKVFLSMGGNFLSAMSDTKAIARAMKKCSLTACVSTKLNRNHIVTGERALILPCLGRTEIDEQDSGTQFVTVENSMGIVHSSEGRNQPASTDLLSEPAIISGIATAIEGRISMSNLNWTEIISDYDNVRNLIEETIPGFDDYNSRVRRRSGFYLPNGPRDSLLFHTDTGRANFRFHPITAINPKSGEFIMMTIRSHDQYNTTVYSENDRYRGVSKGRRVVLMNPQDAANLSLQSGDQLNLSSHFDGEIRQANNWYLIEYNIPRGNLATYFPEANELIPLTSTAYGSNTPTSKSVRVTVERIQD